MAMNEREHHIKVLEQFLHDYQAGGEDIELDKTIKYAISSLKTDLKYDLLCEGEEIYTKADIVAMLGRIRAEIAEYGSIMVSYAINKDTKTDKGIEKLVSGVLKQAKEQVLEIIDKYKAEVEPQGSEGT